MSKNDNKKLQEFLENHLKDHPNISMQEFSEVVKFYSPNLDIDKLINREHRSKACRIAKKVKNKTGDRRVYANKEKGLWIDIEGDKDNKNLDPIRKKLEYQADGNRKAYRLITGIMAENAGQTLLEFEQSETSIERVGGF